MNVLVTGGTGFLGWHVVKALGDAGHTRVVLGRRPFRTPTAGVKNALADVRDYEAVAEAVSKSDGVIHLSGLSGTELSLRYPGAFVKTNVLGSINVFDACRFFGKPCVYASVGNAEHDSVYAISKYTAERLALMYAKEHGTRIVPVRIFNVYGDREKFRLGGKLVPTAVAAALDDRPITLFGDGRQTDDFVYVKDVAGALARAVADPDLEPGRVWHLGTGKATAVREVAEAIVRLTGSSSRIELVGRKRAGEDVTSAVADPGRALVPDYPFTPLEDGLRATVEDALSRRPALGASRA